MDFPFRSINQHDRVDVVDWLAESSPRYLRCRFIRSRYAALHLQVMHAKNERSYKVLLWYIVTKPHSINYIQLEISLTSILRTRCSLLPRPDDTLPIRILQLVIFEPEPSVKTMTSVLEGKIPSIYTEIAGIKNRGNYFLCSFSVLLLEPTESS